MSDSTVFRPIPLLPEHPIGEFDCGDDALNRFYERFDFEPLPGNEFHLVMLMKDLKRAVGSTSGPSGEE